MLVKGGSWPAASRSEALHINWVIILHSVVMVNLASVSKYGSIGKLHPLPAICPDQCSVRLAVMQMYVNEHNNWLIDYFR